MHTFTHKQSYISFSVQNTEQQASEKKKKKLKEGGKKRGKKKKKVIHLDKNNPKQVYMVLNSNW